MSLKIGFIGAGQMATALARGFVASQETNDGPTISFFDPSSEACDRFSNSISAATLLADAQQVVTSADIVFLSVKLQILPSVLDSIAAVVTLDVLLVSIAAGVRLDVICGRTGSDRVIRVMPNTPCLISQAATALVPLKVQLIPIAPQYRIYSIALGSPTNYPRIVWTQSLASAGQDRLTFIP